MVAFSKLQTPSNRRLIILGGAIIAACWYRLQSNKKKTSPKSGAPPSTSKKDKIAVDGLFFKKLWALLKIVVPGFLTPETGFMLLVSASLVSRTMADLWIIQASTSIERSIIAKKKADFVYYLFQFFLGMIPVALVNSLLRYSLSELALHFRTRMTKYLYSLYMKGFVYYRLGNLDNRIPNADQLLTTDVEKFCGSIAELFSNISKPTLDIIIFSRKLSGALGVEGPMMMLGYLVVSGFILTRIRRPLGRYTVEEQRLEGEFRSINARVITHSEEIAFYGGNKREQETINGSFRRLVSHLRGAHQFRFFMGITDSIITKYFATVVGFLIMSRGFIYGTGAVGKSQSEIMEDYYRNGRMLMSLAGAVGRLVLAGRELTRLAGFTARVTELISVLKELDAGSYQRSKVSEQSIVHTGQSDAHPQLMDTPEFGPNAGKIINKDHIIEFDKVPLVTPNSDVLLPSLSFKVVSGQNVLVAGPNGCGKSSLFRILGGLWPVFGGVLTKPTTDKLFYVPQRPYMTLGTLRDQVLYPISSATGKITDDELYEALKLVQLDHLVDREGGWDIVQDWMDKLSGGEKQRLAMARLFVHRPQFAILDECTSAVSVDVEGTMYTHCKEIGITLFTVSHRKTLWKYHEYVLQFDGRGAYEFKQIDQDATTQFGS